MSDVAGAFKILVQAQPDQAISAFRDILQATDKAASGVSGWTDKVLGLNQAWELGSKMMGLASSAASAIGGAFSDLASRGGEFNELKSSFEGLASSAGLSAEEIVKQIKGISDGTVTVRESMQLANRAIVAGFSGPDIETAFKFAKKLSESGRGDFSELANTIVDSLAKGKYATLATFGIMAEQGESLGSVMGKVADGVNKFPDAAFNYQDSITAISKSWEDFKDAIGGAIDDSLEFQDAISWVQDTIGDLLVSFDFSKITEWTDFSIKSVRVLAENFSSGFSDIKKYMYDAWIGGGETAKSFFESIIKGYYSIKLGAAEAFNFFISGLNTASGGFSTFYNALKFGFAEVGVFMQESWVKAENALTKSLVVMLGEIDKYQAAAAGIMGFEASDQITILANELNKVYIDSEKGAKLAKKENELFLESLGSDLEENTSKAAHLFDGMKIDSDSISKEYAKLSSDISKIVVESSGKTYQESSEIQRKTLNDFKNEVKEADKEEKKRIKEHEKEVYEAYKRESQAAKDAFQFGLSEEEKVFKRQQEDALESYKKEIEKSREYKTEDGSIRFSGNVDEREKELREKSLRDFRRKQEDEMDKFRFNQKQKEREFDENGKKIEIKKDETAEAVKDLVQNQKEVQEQKRTERTEKKEINFRYVPSGNGPLDQIFEAFLRYGNIVAEAENAQVISG